MASEVRSTSPENYIRLFASSLHVRAVDSKGNTLTGITKNYLINPDPYICSGSGPSYLYLAPYHRPIYDGITNGDVVQGVGL